MKLNLERYAELEAKKSELEAIRLLLTGDRWTPGPCVQGRHPARWVSDSAPLPLCNRSTPTVPAWVNAPGLCVLGQHPQPCAPRSADALGPCALRGRHPASALPAAREYWH